MEKEDLVEIWKSLLQVESGIFLVLGNLKNSKFL
jgi:hypothetical protein